MEGKTAKLIVQVVRADKQVLEAMARAEGEPVSVIVRRIIRAATRATTQQPVIGTRPCSTNVQQGQGAKP